MTKKEKYLEKLKKISIYLAGACLVFTLLFPSIVVKGFNSEEIIIESGRVEKIEKENCKKEGIKKECYYLTILTQEGKIKIEMDSEKSKKLDEEDRIWMKKNDGNIYEIVSKDRSFTLVIALLILLFFLVTTTNLYGLRLIFTTMINIGLFGLFVVFSYQNPDKILLFTSFAGILILIANQISIYGIKRKSFVGLICALFTFLATIIAILLIRNILDINSSLQKKTSILNSYNEYLPAELEIFKISAIVAIFISIGIIVKMINEQLNIVEKTKKFTPTLSYTKLVRESLKKSEKKITQYINSNLLIVFGLFTPLIIFVYSVYQLNINNPGFILSDIDVLEPISYAMIALVTIFLTPTITTLISAYYYMNYEKSDTISIKIKY